MSNSSITNNISKLFDTSLEGVSGATSKVSKNVNAAMDKVGKAAAVVSDVVSEKTSAAYGATKETVVQAADSAGGAASSVYDSTRQYVGDVATGKREISYGTIAIGTGIAVAAVAAAPFTGGGSILGAATLATSLAGAGTVATAVGAGIAGAAIGGAIGASKDGTTARAEGYEQGKMVGKAARDAQFRDDYDNVATRLKDIQDSDVHFAAIYAMHAVASASAHAHGAQITQAQQDEIRMFVSGLAAGSIPGDVQLHIDKMYDSPPPLSAAFEKAKKSGIDMGYYEEIITLVAGADRAGERHDAFMRAWNILKAA